jgi:hypothetical protein
MLFGLYSVHISFTFQRRSFFAHSKNSFLMFVIATRLISYYLLRRSNDNYLFDKKKKINETIKKRRLVRQ